MISIVLPTRKRPDRLKVFLDSCISNADNPALLEFLVYIDSDDDETEPAIEKYKQYNFSIFKGERMGSLMKTQNYLFSKSKGEIIGYLADDIRFLTKGWDTAVSDAFVGDMIWLVCPYETHKGCKNAPHGFLSRRAAEILGTFVPQRFSSAYSDQWLFNVYKSIGRLKCLENVKISHDHPGFSTRSKNPDMSLAHLWDDVYNEKSTPKSLERDKRNYNKYTKERDKWIKVLKAHLR